MLGEDNDLGNDLDRLKDKVGYLDDPAKGSLLDAIEEEDIPDIDLEDMDEDDFPKRGAAS